MSEVMEELLDVDEEKLKYRIDYIKEIMFLEIGLLSILFMMPLTEMKLIKGLIECCISFLISVRVI